MICLKKYKNFILLLLNILLPYYLFSQVAVVSTGSNWSYFDNGSLDNTLWKENSYNFNSWPVSKSEFGYGDGDEATIVGFGGNLSNKYITYYFKKEINFGSSIPLNCEIKIDDGAIVYLNGVEVYRNGLPGGIINYNTLALGGVDENGWNIFTIPSYLVQQGSNILSVEIHQISSSSSDVSFDFKCFANFPPPPSGVYINEILASNEKGNTDINGNHSDWIEIFNNTSSPYNLSNSYLTDTKSNLTKFKFSDNSIQLTIQPYSYKLIWASGNIESGADHVSWSLSKGGEFVALTSPDGITVIDSFSFTAQRSDVSFGRLYENIDSLVYFSSPSPIFKNSYLNARRGFLSSPIIDSNAGFYASAFPVSIEYSGQGSDIYYSIDGSNPSLSNITPRQYNLKNSYPQLLGESLYNLDTKSYRSFIYTNPISITSKALLSNYLSTFSTKNDRYPYQPGSLIPKATVIRAETSKSEFLSSEIITKTFFLLDGNSQNNNVYTLPVISLNSQEDNLFDYNFGIMTPGVVYDNAFLVGGRDFFAGNYMLSGKESARLGNFEMFKNNIPTINKNVEIRMQGNSSRLERKKSFRIEFSEGQNFFPNRNIFNTNSILLKTPGTYDVAMHDLSIRVLSDLNTPVQKAYPVITFLNGEYWGVYYIQEYVNEDYLENKFGQSKENFDVFKDSKFEVGSEIARDNLISFLNSNSFNNQIKYDSLNTLVDIDNFIDLICAELFTNNQDWPLNNTFMWRNRVSPNKFTPKSDLDGRWRWILIDFDGALNYPEENAYLRNINHSTAFEMLLLRKLLTNNNFKNQFLNRFADLLNSHFVVSRTSQILTSFISDYSPELDKDYFRWGIFSKSTWLNRANRISGFFTDRNQNTRNQLINQFNLNQQYTIGISVDDSTRGFVKVNSIDIKNSTNGIPNIWNNWLGTYFGGVPIKLTPKANLGSKFKYWMKDGQIIYDSVLNITLTSNLAYIAFFEEHLLSDNPVPQSYDLSSCTYKLTSWSEISPAGTFPKNTIFTFLNIKDPGLQSNIEGYVSGAYNFLKKSRINGLGEQGFSFVNTDSDPENPGFPNGKLGGMILALNTLNLDSASLTWKAKTIVVGSRKYSIRLQYRIGDILPFQDFSPPIIYEGSNISNVTELFDDFKLPNELIGKEYIQLFWKYYYTGIGSTGSRDQISLDDIIVKSYKATNTNISNPSNNGKTYTYFLSKTAFEENSNVFFEHNAVLLPGTLIDSGKTILIEKRTCD